MLIFQVEIELCFYQVCQYNPGQKDIIEVFLNISDKGKENCRKQACNRIICSRGVSGLRPSCLETVKKL